MLAAHDSPICPICQKRLVALQSNGVDLSVCFDGHGAWASAEVVGKITGQKPRTWVSAASAGPFGVPLIPLPRISPVFPSETMCVRSYMGLKIDVCPKTGGIWLDQNEIAAALKVFPADLPKPGSAAGEIVESYFIVEGLGVLLHVVWSVIRAITPIP